MTGEATRCSNKAPRPLNLFILLGRYYTIKEVKQGHGSPSVLGHPCKQETQCWFYVSPHSATLAKHYKPTLDKRCLCISSTFHFVKWPREFWDASVGPTTITGIWSVIVGKIDLKKNSRGFREPPSTLTKIIDSLLRVGGCLDLPPYNVFESIFSLSDFQSLFYNEESLIQCNTIFYKYVTVWEISLCFRVVLALAIQSDN